MSKPVPAVYFYAYGDKCWFLFLEIERLYETQQYRSGDYCAKVRALYALLMAQNQFNEAAREVEVIMYFNKVASGGAR